jgi:hypothetical protein
MGIFARRIEHPLDVAVQCTHDADPGEHRRAAECRDQDQGLHRGLPFRRSVLGLRKSRDVIAGIFKRDELAATGKRYRIVKRAFPPSISSHAVARSSLSAPRATILSASYDNGLCKVFASFQGARIHTSHSSCVVRITGIAFGWIGSMIAFGAVGHG